MTCSYWPPAPGPGQTEGSPRSPRGHRGVTRDHQVTRGHYVPTGTARESGGHQKVRRGHQRSSCPVQHSVSVSPQGRGWEEAVCPGREKERRQPCRRSRRERERVVQFVYTCCVLSRLQFRLLRALDVSSYVRSRHSCAVQCGPGWSGDQCRRGGGGVSSARGTSLRQGALTQSYSPRE